jgi:hypothetical protein
MRMLTISRNTEHHFHRLFVFGEFEEISPDHVGSLMDMYPGVPHIDEARVHSF